MRRARQFILATLAVVAAASIGASAAQADNEVVLCKQFESLCASINQYPKGTVVKALGTKPVLLGKLEETCTHTELEYETLAQMGNPLPVSITRMEFTGCKPCTSVTAENVPYTSSISMDPGGAFLIVVSGLRYTLKGCSLGLTCTYAAETATFEGTNVEGKLGFIGSPSPIGFSGGTGGEMLCGKSVTIDAAWYTTAPSPAYYSLYEL
jgi:hypothetical protein